MGGGVYGHDPDGLFLLAVFAGELVDESTLARTGSAGESNDAGLSRMRKESAQQFDGLRAGIFDGADRAGDGADVTGADTLDPVLQPRLDVGGQT
jgi:hypothetical protein